MAKEIPENEIIQFVGLKELEPMEQEVVQRLTTENYQKIKRELKAATSLKVHIKTYKKQGDKKKFSIHLLASFPGRIIEGNMAQDFELPRAMHKAFTDVREQIHHKFHANTTREKTYE